MRAWPTVDRIKEILHQRRHYSPFGKAAAIILEYAEPIREREVQLELEQIANRIGQDVLHETRRQLTAEYQRGVAAGREQAAVICDGKRAHLDPATLPVTVRAANHALRQAADDIRERINPTRPAGETVETG